MPRSVFILPVLAGLVALAAISPAARAHDAPPPASIPSPGPGDQQAAPPGVEQSPANRHPMRDRFRAANTTHDGELTMDQAQAAGLRNIVNNFGAIDADHKGYVTWRDVHRFMQARKMDCHNGMQPPPDQAPQPG